MKNSDMSHADVTASPVAMSGDIVERTLEPVDKPANHLMPYGAVVKTIFVRANGLPAYNKAYRCRNLYCADDFEQTSG